MPSVSYALADDGVRLFLEETESGVPIICTGKLPVDVSADHPLVSLQRTSDYAFAPAYNSAVL
jgi:hypothetical protein